MQNAESLEAVYIYIVGFNKINLCKHRIKAMYKINLCKHRIKAMYFRRI